MENDMIREAKRTAPSGYLMDDLRSLNAQIEFVLRESLRRSGRLPTSLATEDGEDQL